MGRTDGCTGAGVPLGGIDFTSLERGLDRLQQLPAATKDALVEREAADAVFVCSHRK